MVALIALSNQAISLVSLNMHGLVITVCIVCKLWLPVNFAQYMLPFFWSLIWKPSKPGKLQWKAH